MKRKIVIGILVACIALVNVGCGKESSRDSNKNTEDVYEKVVGTEVEQEVMDDSIEDEASEINENTDNCESGNNIELGIYTYSDEVIKVPMGTLTGGSQRILCNLLVPSNYRFGAKNYDNKNILELDSGAVNLHTVKEWIDHGLLEKQDVIAHMDLHSPQDYYSTAMEYAIYSDEGKYPISYDKYKQDIYEDEYGIDPVEIGSDEHKAFYVENRIIDGAFSLIYSIDEHNFLVVNYEGRYAEKVGIESIAKSIYDMIEIDHEVEK